MTDHTKTVLRTAVTLADLPGHEPILRYLHTLGYRGQITTKSRAYSTTLGQLREHRAAWTRRGYDRPDSEFVDWTYTRPEPLTTGDVTLITSAAHTRHTMLETARTETRRAE